MSAVTNAAESLSKWIAVILAASYVTGFVILETWSNQIGLVDYSILDAAFLAAGFGFLLLCTLSAVGLIAWAGMLYTWLRSGSDSKAKVTTGTFIGASVIIVLLSFIVYVIILSGLQALIRGVAAEPLGQTGNYTRHLWIFVNFAALFFLIFGAVRRLTDGGLLPSNLGIVLLVASLILFGKSVYGTIPAQLGGGAPRTVKLLLSDDKASLLKMLGIPFEAGENPINRESDQDGLLLTGELLLFGGNSERYTLRVPECAKPAPECANAKPIIFILNKDEVVGLVR